MPGASSASDRAPRGTLGALLPATLSAHRRSGEVRRVVGRKTVDRVHWVAIIDGDDDPAYTRGHRSLGH
jgi:hypothetical protein